MTDLLQLNMFGPAEAIRPDDPGAAPALVRPCEFTGLTDCNGCPASRCFYEPDDEGEEYDEERDLCDQCGTTSPALLNGLCPMCYECNGGVLLHGPRQTIPPHIHSADNALTPPANPSP
jgi:hypothetical protein